MWDWTGHYRHFSYSQHNDNPGDKLRLSGNHAHECVWECMPLYKFTSAH